MARKDGKLLKDIDCFQRFYTYLMPRRVQSACWSIVQADAAAMLKLIQEKKEAGIQMTVFHVVIAALIRTASQYPELNRFIYGHKFYARTDYTISFAITMEEKTVFRKLWLDPEITLDEVSQTILSTVSHTKKKPNDSLDHSVEILMKLPSFLTRFITGIYPWMVDKGLFPSNFVEDDVLYSSAVVSNLGSFGIGAPIHHLYEWGNTSVFLTLGAIRKIPVVRDDNTISAMDLIDFGFTVDERICSGKKITDALNYFKMCIENPKSLEEKPVNVVRE